MSTLIVRNTYDGVNRHGTSCYIRALRLGTYRWHVELYAAGIYVRLGRTAFSAGVEFTED